jgi:hypothetical protein
MPFRPPNRSSGTFYDFGLCVSLYYPPKSTVMAFLFSVGWDIQAAEAYCRSKAKFQADRNFITAQHPPWCPFSPALNVHGDLRRSCRGRIRPVPHYVLPKGSLHDGKFFAVVYTFTNLAFVHLESLLRWFGKVRQTPSRRAEQTLSKGAPQKKQGPEVENSGPRLSQQSGTAHPPTLSSQGLTEWLLKRAQF